MNPRLDNLSKPLMAAIVLGLTLFGCGTNTPSTRTDFRGPETFPPQPGLAIAPRWILVSEFKVSGMSQYDANVEVAVQGIRQTDGSTRCELVLSHQRFRADRSWSTLPVALFTAGFTDSSGKEDLNALFQDSLDFENPQVSPQLLTVRVSFTRGKRLTTDWRIYPYLTSENGAPACSAVATVEQSPQAACHDARCRLRRIVAVVDVWRYLLQASKPNREIDDLSSLTLELEDLDAQGIPNGVQYSARVPEFR